MSYKYKNVIYSRDIGIYNKEEMVKSFRVILFFLELSFFTSKKIFHDFEGFILKIQSCYLRAASTFLSFKMQTHLSTQTTIYGGLE